MAILSSFEILAENLVPDLGGASPLPPGAPNPFVIQGYFVQVSLPLGLPSTLFNVLFRETNDFRQGMGHNILLAQIIDATGTVHVYKEFFHSTGRGFLDQQISAGQTLIYGVQAIPGLAGPEVEQAGTGWRGYVEVESRGPAGSLVATPTQRLVYYKTENIADPNGVVDAVVYPVPTASGGTRI